AVGRYGAWLAQAPIAKLFINADPGALLIGPAREFCRRWPNQREVTVPGIHFVQEDAPAEIGAAFPPFLLALPSWPPTCHPPTFRLAFPALLPAWWPAGHLHRAGSCARLRSTDCSPPARACP